MPTLIAPGATTQSRAQAKASASKNVGDGVRRTPYHQREAYLNGDTAKKASIIRTVLRMGHKVLTDVDKSKSLPVTDARSRKDWLEIKVDGKWVVSGVVFVNPGRK